MSPRWLVLALLLPGLGCQNPPPVDETVAFFDEAVLHEVSITVAPEFLPLLNPDNREHIPCTLAYDGVQREDVGIHIKGFIGSVQDLSGKPGFSIKVDEFRDQQLFGLEKFTLNNAVQDPSFVSEHLGYEIWRRMGVPAYRTAYARLSFNGEYFGVYVVREVYTPSFLEKSFADGSGNLYEGIFGVDVINVDELDLDTNKDINDRSDVIALRDVIVNTPDDQFVEAVSRLVDLDEFLTFWAVEVLTYHWDGYAQFGTFGCCSPNNYFIYHEPTQDKISFLPHGADQLFQDLFVDVTSPPSPGASLATRLFAQQEIRQRLADKLREVLATAWDTEELEARMDAAAALFRASLLEFDRNPGFSPDNLEPSLESRRQYLRERPQIVLDQLTAAGF